MKDLKFQNFALELKASPDEEGRFEGYGSVFNNLDRGGDVVMPGAFAESLKVRTPKMLWQHDPWQPIGVWEEAVEDSTGLHVRGRLLTAVEKGREAYELLKANAINGMSIGYRTVKDEWEGRVRKLMELELWEVSVVTFPMNEAAEINSVKSLENVRDFERDLRDVFGLTQKQAKALLGGGWKGLQAERDVPGGLEPEDLTDLQNQLRKLQETLNA